MKINISKLLYAPIAILITSLLLVSCEDLVEDGYRIDYGPTDAALTIEPMGSELGAAGDVISYVITANSNQIIKSLVISTSQPGISGSGYDVGETGFDDPFADHIYGTMQKQITSFKVKYDYIIPSEINKAKLVFSLIDEMGKVSSEVDLAVVAPIKKYNNNSLYAKDNLFFDAFATINGNVYEDIKSNYSIASEENVGVQEKIDIMLYYDKNGARSIICAPNHGANNLELFVENATKFKILENITEEDYEEITAASLYELTKEDSIAYYGSSSVVAKVGSIIGFSTDIYATHASKTGLLKVNSLHPTNIPRYEGTSYVMECDVVTQIDE